RLGSRSRRRRGSEGPHGPAAAGTQGTTEIDRLRHRRPDQLHDRASHPLSLTQEITMKNLQTKLSLATETPRSLNHDTTDPVPGGTFSGDHTIAPIRPSAKCPVGSCVPNCTGKLPGTKTAEVKTIGTLGTYVKH